jgi:autotransporter-associated beta strand protein
MLFPVLIAGFSITSVHADPLAVGDKIGVDFGGATTATNWNNFTALGSIGAGSVSNLAGNSVDDVSITVASNVVNFWGDGTSNWAGLSTNGGSAPPEFVDAVTNDFGGFSGVGGMTITLSGLDPTLDYNIYGVTFVNAVTTRRETLTVVGDVSYGSSELLRSASVAGAFHTFTAVSPDGSGTITITLTEPTANNGIISGMLIEAVEPPAPPPTPYYWNTTTGTWATGANWSDNAVSGGTTGTVPTSIDSAVFNQSSVNGAETVQLDDDHSIAGIAFANTDTTLIDSDSATPRILTLGSAGLTVDSGAGAVTLGDIPNIMDLSLGAAQTWTNHSASTLTAVNGISLANAGAQTLTVTGSGNSALSGAITNGSGTLGLTKSGAGTLSLSGANLYTGYTVVAGGTLDVASGGSLTDISALNTKGGGAMTLSGTVTMANNGSFGVGAGVTGTTGSLTLNTGGVLNIGGGGGYIAIGGRDVTGAGLGNGTLTMAGGTLNVAAPGTVSNGLDATNFWMNPYGSGGGTSTLNLDGGIMSTLRMVQYGGAGTAIVNLNGGTLQSASGYTGGFFGNTLSRINVRDGGAVIDTNGNNNTVTAVLRHSNVGGDAAADGGLTKLGLGTLTLTAANTYTGNTTVEEGTLVLDQAFLNDDADVELSTGATLQLDFAGSDTINALRIDGSPQATGTWGRTGHPTAQNTSSLITGDGLLQVGAARLATPLGPRASSPPSPTPPRISTSKTTAWPAASNGSSAATRPTTTRPR